jgi:pilus assembly protein CpaB
MDVRRVAIALVVALAISAGATYLVYSRMRASQEAQRPQTVKIVAATNPLQAGSALTSENVTLIDWPSNIPLTGSFSKANDVIGRSLIYPVSPKQPIMERDLAVAGSGIGLTVKIPEGMRAVSVRSNDITGVAGFLFPGSHVDVLLTYRPEGSPSPVTQTIMQNVEVLTAGQRIEPDPQGKPETVNVVTMLLSPQDAEKLIMAYAQGSIQFVLRNGADKLTAETKPVFATELFAGARKAPENRQVAAVGRRAPRPAKINDFYVVETIAGDKRSSEKFEQNKKIQ